MDPVQSESDPNAHENAADGLDPRALMPGAQGSVIPLGWKPTVAKPVPVTRCVVIKKDGARCGRWSMRGMTKCYAHGKRELNFPNVAAHKEAVIEAARMRLLDVSDDAVDALEQLLQPGTSEGIRLKAATEILDRNGIRGGFEVEVEVEHKEDPASTLASRLKTLRERGKQALEAEWATEEEPDVIEGEVVEGDDNQGTLF